MNISEIDTPMIVKFLEPVWRATPQTASRTLGRVEKVLDAAKASGLRHGENPARWRGHLEHVLGAKPKPKHHAAMPFSDLPVFTARLRDNASISARALEFTILTAARSNEVRGAMWREVDLTTRIWTIPADRMKAGREHSVPLSVRAVTILKGLPRVDDLVFSGMRERRPLSDMAMTQLLRGMDCNGYTVHGFRSSFRDWCGDRSAFDRETIEHALAHRLPDRVEASYRRSTALEKRRRLMDAWSRYLETRATEATVTPIGTRA